MLKGMNVKMDRIAIISDIHGNREALKTTLEDIKRRKCDKIMCLGDLITKGRFSNECVDLIRENCDVVLQWNVELFEPNVLTLSDKIADIVVYGHIHTQLMNKMYNRTLICCGSIGNNLEYIRNEKKDANILNTTCANYVILEGKMDSKEHHTLDIDFIQVQYDIDKELKDSKDKLENDALFYELKNGKYRDDNKINKILTEQGIDINNI